MSEVTATIGTWSCQSSSGIFIVTGLWWFYLWLVVARNVFFLCWARKGTYLACFWQITCQRVHFRHKLRTLLRTQGGYLLAPFSFNATLKKKKWNVSGWLYDIEQAQWSCFRPQMCATLLSSLPCLWDFTKNAALKRACNMYIST